MKNRKNVLKDVCMLVCGLVIGAATAYCFGLRCDSIKDVKNSLVEKDYAQVYGIDVSYWQGYVNWDGLQLPCDEEGRVSGSIPVPHQQRPAQFSFIRATKGDSYIDPNYKRNYSEAKRLGIPCGSYHFLTDSVSGKAQAELFLAHVRLEQGDLPPVLDVEIDSPAEITAAKEWLDIVEKECGVKAMIYTTTHIYNTRIVKDSIMKTRDLWLALPIGKSFEKPKMPNCKFWQFSQDGHVWGVIDNSVDLDMFMGSKQELEKYIEEKGIK